MFGTFDGIHDGHRAYIEEAQTLADRITIVLTPDKVIKTLKGYMPRFSVEERKALLEQESSILNIIYGDETMNTWQVLEKLSPDAILLGYDQNEIYTMLVDLPYIKENNITILRAQPYKPETYHNSLLYKPQ
jgi:cytidyltransferase-like protein